MSAEIDVEKWLYGTEGNDLRGLLNMHVNLGAYGYGGDDTLIGSWGSDLLVGGDGNDDLNGNPNHDHLFGNAGDDTLDGGEGGDEMRGGTGNDTYYVNSVNDEVIESGSDPGIDRVFSTIDYTLGNYVENLNLSGPNAIDGTGNTLDNRIFGNDNDNILSGSAGNDVLVGGDGMDVLKGGTGRDIFIFNSPLNANTNMDRIIGFVSADDTIRLDDDVFTQIGFLGNPTSAAFFRVGTEAQDASDRIIYDQATGNLFYDADGTGAAAQVRFAHIGGTPILSHADFSVID